MSDVRYHCCDLGRRNEVFEHPTLNGLEALEVIDRDLPLADPLRQRTLLLFFLKPVTSAGFTRDDVHIIGGERLRDPAVVWVGVASAPPPELAGPGEADVAAIVAALPEPDQVLVVRVDSSGDYSPYLLRLALGSPDGDTPADFDPRMRCIDFSFKVECPSDFDCQVTPECPPEDQSVPDINYLARDYQTFRRLMLDRLAQQVPDWAPGSAADAGIALVELLAYVGDQLSYRQDAIATEAYLGTARRRVSARRHARLVDYPMHDGCNARTFVHLELDSAVASLMIPASDTQLLTRCVNTEVPLATGSTELAEAMQQRPVVFETMEEQTLFREHNELKFYTWSDTNCCLPEGATRATLLGEYPNLEVDDWLLFEEVRGPQTGVESDADPTQRQVVRLTGVETITDPVPTPPVTVTEISWTEADALRFPLCISASRKTEEGIEFYSDVSVARGNLVLADHGRTLDPEDLPVVPAGRILVPAGTGVHCEATQPREIPARYRPQLAEGPVTQVAALDPSSAVAAMASTVDTATPAIILAATLGGALSGNWGVRRTLLDSDPNDRHFVVEVEADGRATLRFGDGRYGDRPETDTRFQATYRIGNGTPGNIGAEALAHVVGVDVSAIVRVRNPLPADRGVDPESVASVRRRAPEAFRRQERAVTPTDYSAVTEQYEGVGEGVDSASSRLRWTGSWHTMFITVDRTGGEPLDDEMESALIRYLDGYRMAGHDVDFEPPGRVSIGMHLHVCVEPGYFRSDVRQRLRDLLSSGTQRNGQPGLFHPDSLTFGTTVYLSPILAAAHDVPGVASVEARVFGRQNDDDPIPLQEGRVVVGPREIPRLENDPNFPEHGVLTLELHGGK